MNIVKLLGLALLLVAILACLVAPDALARCVLPGPRGATDPGMRPVPSRNPDGGMPVTPTGDEGTTPSDEPPADEGEPPPDVAGEGPPPEPKTGNPATPPSAPAGPIGSPGAGRPTSPAGPRRAPGQYLGGAWRIWWELSREHLLGLRGTLKDQQPVSGVGIGDADMLRRLSARAALRELAARATDPSLRAVSLRALGRVGDDEDAGFLFLVMRMKSLPDEVLEGAAIGLASLPHIEDEELRAELRAFFDGVLSRKIWLPDRTRLLTILAISLRGRDDAALVRSLGGMLTRDPGSGNDAAALLYACGLTKDRMLASELCAALTGGKVATRTLPDVARAHAAMGLALSAEPGTVEALASVLDPEKTGVHTRRGAALALGVLLRNGELEGDRLLSARKALLRAFEEDRDPLVQGYCLLAMGTAREPFGLDVLVKTVDKTGRAAVKPFAAIALGHATRRLEGRMVKKVRDLLFVEFKKSRDTELAGALSIAVGLSGNAQAGPMLFERATDEGLNPAIRGPAIEALGLLGVPSPKVVEALTKTLDSKARGVVEQAALALGLLGRTDTARLLVEKMATTRSQGIRDHMVVALSHLGGTTAVAPLLEVLKDGSLKPDVRESAAEALGVLLDPREVDPLFELDAACNPYGLTDATRELIRIY